MHILQTRPCLTAVAKQQHLPLQAERKHRSHEAEVQSYQQDWQQHVLSLKDYFQRQGLQNVDPSG